MTSYSKVEVITYLIHKIADAEHIFLVALWISNMNNLKCFFHFFFLQNIHVIF